MDIDSAKPTFSKMTVVHISKVYNLCKERNSFSVYHILIYALHSERNI